MITTIDSQDAGNIQTLNQHIVLIWIHAPIKKDDDGYSETMKHLYEIVDDVNFFYTVHDALQYLKMVYAELVLVIVSEPVESKLIQEINRMPHVHGIFIFTTNVDHYKSWTIKFPKFRCTCDHMVSIYMALQRTIRAHQEDETPISFTQISETDIAPDSRRLEPSYLYTKLIKTRLLSMTYDRESRKEFIQYCREIYAENRSQMDNIDEFDREYSPEKVIQWYTRQSFIFEILNQSLRLLQTRVLVMMGFFLYDLHGQLERLYKAQINLYGDGSIKIYRGQGLSIQDFNKLRHAGGSLMSFNSFLSTSTNHAVAMSFAESVASKSGTVGIVFVMDVKRKTSSTPIVVIKDYSFYDDEEEVLLSMHSIFRVKEIRRIESLGKVFEVDLTMTQEDDPDLNSLLQSFLNNARIIDDCEGLLDVLLFLGETETAADFYTKLLAQSLDNEKQRKIYHKLAVVKFYQCDYKQAVELLEKELSILEQIPEPDHVEFASAYHNIANVYYYLEDLSHAQIYMEKALIIFAEHLSSNHRELATCYSNMGVFYDCIDEYSKALECQERALTIRENIYPSNHPDIATTFLNISRVYYLKKEYSEALTYYQKALRIREVSLPQDHHDLAESYFYIGLLNFTKKRTFRSNLLL